MRNELRNIGSNERYTFSAMFVRFGMKNGYNFEKRLNCPIENDYKLSYPTHIQILKRGHDYEYKNQSN